MTLDPDLVRQRCDEIADAVPRLERIAAAPLDRSLADRPPSTYRTANGSSCETVAGLIRSVTWICRR